MSTLRGWVAASSTPAPRSPACQPSEGGWLLAVLLYLHQLLVNPQRVDDFYKYPCTHISYMSTFRGWVASNSTYTYITCMSTLRGWVASNSTPVPTSPTCQPSKGGWLPTHMFPPTCPLHPHVNH